MVLLVRWYTATTNETEYYGTSTTYYEYGKMKYLKWIFDMISNIPARVGGSGLWSGPMILLSDYDVNDCQLIELNLNYEVIIFQ